MTPSEFREDDDAGKTGMIGLPYGETNFYFYVITAQRNLQLDSIERW